MKIKADLSKGTLEFEGAKIAISNKVRSMLNGQRRKDEVVRSIPAGLPYDPREFPKGTWNVTGVEWHERHFFDEYTYGPVKIRTDAEQSVHVWRLDDDGDYRCATEQTTTDSGYLLHYSSSKTTLGCIRIERAKDAVLVAKVIESALKARDTVRIEVV